MVIYGILFGDMNPAHQASIYTTEPQVLRTRQTNVRQDNNNRPSRNVKVNYSIANTKNKTNISITMPW